MTEPQTDADNLLPETISRRRTMQAALGGAVAGAAFAAPKVKGFSIAPDYAAAGSLCADTSTVATNWTMPGQTGGHICWDGSTFGCCTNSGKCNGSRNVGPFLVATGTGGGPNLNATVQANGFFNDTTVSGGTNGGSLIVTVDGITNHTNQKCTTTANIASDCGGWTGPQSVALTQSNATQAQLGPVDFNCSYRIAADTVTVSVTCTCA